MSELTTSNGPGVKSWTPDMPLIDPKQSCESDCELALLGDQAAVLIWRAGPDRWRYWFSQYWLDFTGRTLDQELGHGWLENIHTDDRPLVQVAYSQAHHCRKSISVSYRLRRQDGEYRWVLESARPWISPAGHFRGFVGSCVDITEQKRVEQRLFEALAEQDVLLHEVRHRVRNNMQVVLGFVRLLTRHFRGEETTAQLTARIEALAHMQQYLYARPDRIKEVALAEFLRALTDEFARQSHPNIHVSVAEQDITVDLGKATNIGLAVAEALFGMARSADRPHRIRIALRRDGPDRLVVCIESDLEVSTEATQVRLMRQYAHMLAGDVEITGGREHSRILLRLVA